MSRLRTPFYHHVSSGKRTLQVVRYSAVSVLAFVGSTHVALANFSNPLGNVTLYEFLTDILEAVIIILFPIVVLMVVYTGFLFVSAQGKADKLDIAKRSLVWTVVGAIIVLAGLAIVEVIQGTVDQIQG